MSVLFKTVSIGRMELRNRFVRSATYDGAGLKSGHVSEKQVHLYGNLAKGGVGLIISGITSVHASGRISTFQNTVDDDACIPGLKKLADVAHSHGARIALQLFHGGRESAVYQAHRKLQAIAPSKVPHDLYCAHDYREMTEPEILEIIKAFGAAAARARAAGFDAVQLHGAHAYLLSQFLSPYSNHRTDAWGGSPEKRLNFLCETYKSIRSSVGDDYPVLIKIGVEDGFPAGLEFDQGKRAAIRCAEMGFDSLEISQGLRGNSYSQTEFRRGINKPEKEAYFGEWCQKIKARVDVPVMMVGGLRTPEYMEKSLLKGEADFFSLCRPLIKQPDIINQWKKNFNRKPACISCNLCFEAIRRGEAISCLYNETPCTG